MANPIFNPNPVTDFAALSHYNEFAEDDDLVQYNNWILSMNTALMAGLVTQEDYTDMMEYAAARVAARVIYRQRREHEFTYDEAWAIRYAAGEEMASTTDMQRRAMLSAYYEAASEFIRNADRQALRERFEARRALASTALPPEMIEHVADMNDPQGAYRERLRIDQDWQQRQQVFARAEDQRRHDAAETMLLLDP